MKTLKFDNCYFCGKCLKILVPNGYEISCQTCKDKREKKHLEYVKARGNYDQTNSGYYYSGMRY